MKIRVTLMTENDKPVSTLGDNAEEKAKRAWEYFCYILNGNNPEERATVESVEIVGD